MLMSSSTCLQLKLGGPVFHKTIRLHDVCSAWSAVIRLSLCLFIACGLFRVASVDASPSREELERSHLEVTRGEEASRAKQYKEALQHFLKAEELVPDLKNKISIAILYHRLNRCSDSFYTWLDVLSRCAEGCPYHDRAREYYLKMTSSCTAPIEIASTPSASVMLDDRYIGMTPLNTRLLFGSHQVELRLDGHRSFIQRLQVEPLAEGARPQRFDVTLEPLFDRSILLDDSDPDLGVEERSPELDKIKKVVRFVSLGFGVITTTAGVILHSGDAKESKRSFISQPLSRGNQILFGASVVFGLVTVATFF